MAIADFIAQALRELQSKHYDQAMAAACMALDATAKHEYGERSTKRCKQFVNDHLDIITKVGFAGAILAVPGGKLKLKNPKKWKTGGVATLEKIIYDTVRCGLIHEAELPPGVRFTEESRYGEFNGHFEIPVNLIYSLVLAVIGAGTNHGESLDTGVSVTVSGVELHLGTLWGKRTEIRKALGLT